MEQKILSTVLSQIKHGTLETTFWDGTTRTFGHGSPQVAVLLRTPGFLRRAVKNPSLAFGEAYINGDIEVVSPMEDVLKLAELNPLKLESGNRRRQLRGLNKNKKSNQAAFVAHHYDLGNEFYKLWLDSTMSYSCAYFKRHSDSLQTAQQQKTAHILRKLQLTAGSELLDIGSGWGYLLVSAAKLYGVRGLGISLSQEQVNYSQELAKHEHVENLVTFEYLNYQDIPKDKQFDRIVSVGFFEHVGRNNLADYFVALNRHLRPDGISVLHSITHQDESPSDAWIDKYIFPGGYIPSVRETTNLIAEHGFQMFDYENLGQHYGLTIDRWWRNYERNKSKIVKMYDEQFYRMWRLYLIGAMMAFKTGNASLSQWIFKQGQNPAWPLTREYLYRESTAFE
ncbi:MAG: cyclopropane-fatty-acyl-phospholipid synthase family protein [Candidatus Saccharibacteria bacterium]